MIPTDNDRSDPESGLIEPAIAAFESAARGEKVLVSVVKGLNYVVQMADCREALQASRADAHYAADCANDLHNISMAEEIERRAWQRRDAEIQKLLRPNDGSEAVGA
jgi:hypothetical protein